MIPAVRSLLLAAAALLVVSGLYMAARRPAARPEPRPEARSALQPTAVPAPDTAERRRLQALERIRTSDSYLGAMLANGDSMLKRWRPRVNQPVTVYLPESGPGGHTVGFDRVAREAFTRWQRAAGIPIHFVFARDSGGAEVHVRWVEKFPMPRAGQADIVWNQHGWLVRGTLILATHTHRGWPLTEDAVYTVALHEIGHLLGLGHSDDPRDLMYPSTAVQDLTGRDRQTVALLYALSPGPLSSPRAAAP